MKISKLVDAGFEPTTLEMQSHQTNWKAHENLPAIYLKYIHDKEATNPRKSHDIGFEPVQSWISKPHLTTTPTEWHAKDMQIKCESCGKRDLNLGPYGCITGIAKHG